MTTTSANIFIREGKRLVYPCDTSGSNNFNQGDLVYFDHSTHLLKVAASDANCQYLAGIAGVANPTDPRVYGSTDNYQKNGADVHYGCVVTLKTTASETYYHGTEVSFGADAQTVTTVAGTYPVGRVWLENTSGSVTGASGTTVQVLVYNRDITGAAIV
jgi:hypothetical protein